MNVVEKIKCPNCGTEINVNAALSSEIEEKLKAGIAAQQAKSLAEIEKLRKEKDELGEKIRKEKEKEFTSRLSSEREKLREEFAKETGEELKALQKSLKEKSEQVIEFNKTKSELEKLKLEKDEIEAKIAAEKDAELTKRLKAERDAHKASLESEKERIKRESWEENAAKLAELQKKLDDQTALAAEMKRKAEQGSMQLQGEVQELAIEDVLRDTFRFDKIEPVPKGVKGADVIQKVYNNTGSEVGIIVYESKRTKAFGKDWIGKLKSDGAIVSADICVLVTETLPDGVERIGHLDGVWVCTFSEFKGLALVLRDSLVKISAASATQENRGEKMKMLYDYLTGKEFNIVFKSILESFSDLQKGYLDERARMEKIWKTREKQLEKVVLNANSFIGSIKGIAGTSFADIPQEIPLISDKNKLLL